MAAGGCLKSSYNRSDVSAKVAKIAELNDSKNIKYNFPQLLSVSTMSDGERQLYSFSGVQSFLQTTPCLFAETLSPADMLFFGGHCQTRFRKCYVGSSTFATFGRQYFVAIERAK